MRLWTCGLLQRLRLFLYLDSLILRCDRRPTSRHDHIGDACHKAAPFWTLIPNTTLAALLPPSLVPFLALSLSHTHTLFPSLFHPPSLPSSLSLSSDAFEELSIRRTVCCEPQCKSNPPKLYIMLIRNDGVRSGRASVWERERGGIQTNLEYLPTLPRYSGVSVGHYLGTG